jgi:ribosomal subunit interface protein
MQTPIQITFRGIAHSDALEAHIRQKAEKLEEFHSRIISCRVTVEKFRKHHQQGRQFRVSIDLRVPGKEIVANRDHHEDVNVALRDAFDTAKRQLEDTARQMRGDVKAHPVLQRGKVAKLLVEEGYGFIETADGREFYFSRDNVVHPTFDDLGSGAEVSFIEEMASEGLQAKRVSVEKQSV